MGTSRGSGSLYTVHVTSQLSETELWYLYIFKRTVNFLFKFSFVTYSYSKHRKGRTYPSLKGIFTTCTSLLQTPRHRITYLGLLLVLSDK